ncbi:MAG: PadR family transcriptional regulator [Candidatus Bathyarchaeota archaeon]|nr:MAG: PadR family transcriptional regulator [Candidatus Bathyarchaeota archaeon]
MVETFKNRIVQRFSKNFLDILVLRLVQAELMWGYKIIKKTEILFGIKLRHGAIYPLLNSLEANGFLRSKIEVHGRRKRKVYEITSRGIQFVSAYYDFLRDQLQMLDIKD